MKKVKDMCSTNECGCKKSPASSGAVYGIGVVGALIYFISTANGFWMGLLGIIKALFWPAFLVFELLKYFAV